MGTTANDVTCVLDARAELGISPGTLRFSAGIEDADDLIEDFDRGLALLRRLKGLGVRISMDDFGSGYSSLSYLERLPVDLLKIDRSFTASLGDDREIPVLLRSIIKLGQTLGLQVLAEGIERGDQVIRLRELGCRLGQGYHFSPPLPADAVPDALAGRWETSLSA